MDLSQYIRDVRREFRGLKTLAEGAMGQIDDEQFFSTLSEDANSVAIVVKHMAGNLRSRWGDFLTTDGEKPDRNRDSEFVLEVTDTRDSLLSRWEEGWNHLFTALDALEPADLASTVHIRGEPHSVSQAIHRQLTHQAYHVGQVVFISRVLCGGLWKSLSIPRDKSGEFNQDPRSYLPE